MKTALEVLKKLKEASFQAYLVGGYPRDVYLKRPSLDFDICTNATPKQIKAIFPSATLSKQQYGAVTIYVHRLRFEITTFRKEQFYQDYRRPSCVEYIDDLKEDLSRRDFTMNTLCIDENGQLLDLLGGKKDIDAKMIRMVGNPEIRLKEDALRILRAIRFVATLDFSLDPELKKYIAEYGHYLVYISNQRKKEELTKIFSSSNYAKGIVLLEELGLGKFLQLKNLKNVKPSSMAIGIWAQVDPEWLYPYTKEEKITLKKLKYLRKENPLDPLFLYDHGPYLSSILGELQGISRIAILKRYQTLPIQSRKDLLITAEEIGHALAIAPGPKIKEAYRYLEIKIIKGTLSNQTKAILEALKSFDSPTLP